MQYLMLVYMDQSLMEKLPKSEMDQLVSDCDDYHLKNVASGHALGAARLRGTETATTLRHRNGALAVIDGPFAETKEVFGGYELLECKDLDEAIAVASGFPGLRFGFSCELRPVDEDPAFRRSERS